MVSSFTHLTYFNSFSMPPIPVNDLTIRSLAILPQLTEWITNGRVALIATGRPVAASRIFFPSLQILGLHGENFAAVTELLNALQSELLCKFTYTHHAPRITDKTSIGKLMNAITRHEILDDLFLSSDTSLHTLFAHLDSLSRLPMRKVHLYNLVSNSELTNESLAWLTRSWPELEAFYCCNNDSSVSLNADRTLPTCEIFAHFAAHCPRLLHLSLTLDVLHEPASDPDEALPRCATPLFFHPHAMMLSRLTDMYRTVEYITAIYPRLSLRLSDDIKYSDPDTVEILDEVNSRIPEIVQRRAAERMQRRASVSPSEFNNQ